MTCEEALNLLNARIDGEISPDDATRLDAHLAECVTCQQILSDLEVQDAALLRAFAPESASSTQLADRVLQQLTPPQSIPSARKIASERRPLWLSWAIAASVLLGGSVLLWQLLPPHRTDTPTRVVLEPIGQLTLAKGDVFVCPSDQHQWRPIIPGDSIEPGSRLKTADAAKCELQLTGGTKVRLNSGTEARFTDDRCIQINSGQLWSAMPAIASAPLKLIAADATTITASPSAAAPTRLDISCKPGTSTVTVASGAADVAAPGKNQPVTRVAGGQTLHWPPDPGDLLRCVSVPDPGLVRQWQDDLLVLKPGNDAEVLDRVAELLERIGVERKGGSTSAASRVVATVAGPVEQDVRARGQAWSNPFVCYVRGKTPVDRASRRTAARLLADLAPASCIPDLIELLADEDGEVRGSAAMALRRLTGQDFGQPPDLCADAINPAIVAIWRRWWVENRQRYGIDQH